MPILRVPGSGAADDRTYVDPDDTKAELLRRAREFGIEGRWTMSKRELAAALREH
jgi:hypothetical protein